MNSEIEYRENVIKFIEYMMPEDGLCMLISGLSSRGLARALAGMTLVAMSRGISHRTVALSFVGLCLHLQKENPSVTKH